jgi:hypothetical protein
VSGDARLWCDRLVRGLDQHEFDVYALSLGERQEDEGWVPLPPQVNRVRTAPLWTAEDDGVGYGRRARRRFAECYGELAAVLCAGGPADASEEASTPEADRFGNALYGLAELARDQGGLVGALRSETAVRALECACRAPGAARPARQARVHGLLTVAAHLERALRPLDREFPRPRLRPGRQSPSLGRDGGALGRRSLRRPRVSRPSGADRRQFRTGPLRPRPRGRDLGRRSPKIDGASPCIAAS